MSLLRFPRSLIRKLETPELPLQTLEAIRRLRSYLDDLEMASIRKARRMGASPVDIGAALGITRQAVYNRLRAMEERGEAGTETAEHQTGPEIVVSDLQQHRAEP